uniref:Candidate secreted effector n=1 Tax=Meloidogyne incognita TaxID=6306 RepID=A0A914LMJ3_MELIC
MLLNRLKYMNKKIQGKCFPENTTKTILGPKSPASKPFPTTSIIERSISGAEEPRAISVNIVPYSHFDLGWR